MKDQVLKILDGIKNMINDDPYSKHKDRICLIDVIKERINNLEWKEDNSIKLNDIYILNKTDISMLTKEVAIIHITSYPNVREINKTTLHFHNRNSITYNDEDCKIYNEIIKQLEE